MTWILNMRTRLVHSLEEQIILQQWGMMFYSRCILLAVSNLEILYHARGCKSFPRNQDNFLWRLVETSGNMATFSHVSWGHLPGDHADLVTVTLLSSAQLSSQLAQSTIGTKLNLWDWPQCSVVLTTAPISPQLNTQFATLRMSCH